MPKNCGTACDKRWSGVKAFRTSTYTGTSAEVHYAVPHKAFVLLC